MLEYLQIPTLFFSLFSVINLILLYRIKKGVDRLHTEVSIVRRKQTMERLKEVGASREVGTADFE